MTPPLALLAYVPVAVVVLLIVHHGLHKLSRGAAAALLLLPLLFTGKALVLGRVYAPIDIAFQSEPLRSAAPLAGIEKVRNGYLMDVYSQFIPWQRAVRDAFSLGEWPLWNPYMFAGDILAASASPAPYWPFNLIAMLLPLPHALTFLAAMTYFLAGVCMYAYLREIHLGEIASLTGASAWMFSEVLTFWLEWPLGPSQALLPLVLLAVHRCLRRDRPFHTTALATVAFVLLLLAGHPETAQHVVLLAGIYLLFLFRPSLTRAWLRATGRLVLAGVVSLLLCSIYLLPIIDVIPETHEYWVRVEHSRARIPIATWTDAGRATLNNFIPFVHGVAEGEISPKYAALAIPTGYIGAVGLALAIVGLLKSGSSLRWVYGFYLIFGITAGARAPVPGAIFLLIPMVRLAHNQRLALATAFALCALAAFGVQELTRRDWSRRHAAFVFAGTLAAFSALLMSLWGYMRRDLSAAFLQRESLLLLIPLVVATALVIAWRHPAVAPLLLFVLLGQRFLEASDRYPSIPLRAFYPDVPEVRAIPREGLYRMTSMGETFIPNISAMYGLEDVRGYQALTLRTWYHTYGLWCEHISGFYNRIDDLGRPFLSLLNVRFALIPRHLEVPDGWRLIEETAAMRVVENTRVLERAFVPRRVHLGTTNLEALHFAVNFGNESWIAARRRGDSLNREIENGPGRVSIRRDGLGFQISAEMQRDGWVVISETAWEGWRAYIDGTRAALFKANFALLGIHVPEGKHTIRLVYRPDWFVRGALISGGTLTLVVAASIFLALRRRKQRAGQTRRPAEDRVV